MHKGTEVKNYIEKVYQMGFGLGSNDAKLYCTGGNKERQIKNKYKKKNVKLLRDRQRR